jgi:hypothetical protein
MKTRCYVCWMLGVIIIGLSALSCSQSEPPAAPLPDRRESRDDGSAEQSSDAAAHAESRVGNQTAGADVTAPADEFEMPLDYEQAAEGWIALFDGHSLFGWQSNSDGINWSVDDGVITANEGPVGLLNTTVPFADYELKCDFRFEPGGNSGIFLRTVATPEDVNADCYELNLADEHPEGFTTGSLVSHKQTEETIAASGEWHTFHITADGPNIIVRLDDTEVLNFTDEEPVARTSGLIGLQHNKGKVEIKNILLKPLGMSDLFNGEDLSGWRVVPGSQSTFEVEDAAIRVTAEQQGFLETEGTYGDFVFQAEAICHRDPDSDIEPLNSGYFFRAQRGTEEAPSHGYEVQIHNGWKGNDRTQPSNWGTGSIFRRVEARRVIPTDGEWFTTTLVAAGPRIAVWVNGYQVTDWEDTRAPSDNPREGLRLEAGHISLQGHDPTTDLSFRNLRVVELPQ